MSTIGKGGLSLPSRWADSEEEGQVKKDEDEADIKKPSASTTSTPEKPSKSQQHESPRKIVSKWAESDDEEAETKQNSSGKSKSLNVSPVKRFDSSPSKPSNGSNHGSPRRRHNDRSSNTNPRESRSVSRLGERARNRSSADTLREARDHHNHHHHHHHNDQHHKEHKQTGEELNLDKEREDRKKRDKEAERDKFRQRKLASRLAWDDEQDGLVPQLKKLNVNAASTTKDDKSKTPAPARGKSAPPPRAHTPPEDDQKLTEAEIKLQIEQWKKGEFNWEADPFEDDL